MCSIRFYCGFAWSALDRPVYRMFPLASCLMKEKGNGGTSLQLKPKRSYLKLSYNQHIRVLAKKQDVVRPSRLKARLQVEGNPKYEGTHGSNLSRRRRDTIIHKRRLFVFVNTCRQCNSVNCFVGRIRGTYSY